ncbi:MAG: hypothetical protein HFH61_03815 [Lachnospiraceae bacterium]|nr:hypothetical protein [Lachnospiraceae bacterium]
MQVSTAPTSSSKFLYFGTDKKSYIIDDVKTEVRVSCLPGEGKYEFKMKDGTKNTLSRALSRLDGKTRSYLYMKYNPSRIWLDSMDARNLMTDLYNRDIISEDEFLSYNCVEDEMICLNGMKSGDQGLAPDQPNIYQAFKALGKEKWEKAQYREGEEREKLLKKSEMFTRLAGILENVYGEVQGIVTNEMMCESFQRSIQQINSPYFSDEKNQELLAKFLEKAKDEIDDSMDEIVSPKESEEEKLRRMRAWEKERFYQETREKILST